jgi:hypothetical protein
MLFFPDMALKFIYSEERLRKAVEDFRSGILILIGKKLHSVLRSTLHDKYHGKTLENHKMEPK